MTRGRPTLKNCNFAVLEKNVMRRSPPQITPALIIAAALVLGNPSFADVFHFQLALVDLPGVEDFESSNVQAGIDVLEEQLEHVEKASSGRIWATLCAAYIVNDSLDQAERACTNAIEIEPTYSAYNNRGVLRVRTGDLIGAREDFGRVRPLDMDAYMDELKRTSPRLVAASNFDMINQMLAKHGPAESNDPVALSTAAIEDLNN